MLPRLDEIEEDLLARRKRAVTEGWQGEIEGIDLAVTFLRSKREQTRGFEGSGPVSLGPRDPRTADHPPQPRHEPNGPD
ncbi:recombinase [Streptomyces sp. NPDC090798]|uniref:recombinase n=1 Tax=Streptomyces sp. NPDC090798 TaxID=3365968 RepID=UPI0038245C11